MEDDEMLEQLQQELSGEKSKNLQLGGALAGSSFQGQQDNLIQYQLDSGELLNMIEHFLKGEYLSVDKDGGEFWTTPKNKDLVLFNEYGVNSIMVIVGKYINKNTFLSFYSEDRIYEIMGDLGTDINNFIFCNYEKMGMDTEFKKTRYNLTVLTILHIIESAYRRSMHGRTMEELNRATIMTQSDLVGSRLPSMSPRLSMKKKFSLLKPATW